MLVWNTINVYKPEDKIEFSKWKELIQQELWKGKNDKMIYLYSNWVIEKEKMDNYEAECQLNLKLSQYGDWGKKKPGREEAGIKKI